MAFLLQAKTPLRSNSELSLAIIRLSLLVNIVYSTLKDKRMLYGSYCVV